MRSESESESADTVFGEMNSGVDNNVCLAGDSKIFLENILIP